MVGRSRVGDCGNLKRVFRKAMVSSFAHLCHRIDHHHDRIPYRELFCILISLGEADEKLGITFR